MTPPLASRPNASNAILLLTGPQPAGQWNGRDFPPFPGFSDADTQAIWLIVRDAYKSWNLDITTDATTTKDHSTIAFANLFGGYPISGGQANENSFGTPGIGAFVFVDQLANQAWAIGRDCVHEAGHTLNLQHVMDASGYAPGFWMGNPFIGTPVWTSDQRSALDQRFGPAADLNMDGKVDLQDMAVLRQGGYSASEAMAVIRGVQATGSKTP
jgi:hypothetical protein